jgi:hypothetical protein
MAFSAILNAQEIFQPSARDVAMAEVSAPFGGGWSVFGNQAGLAGIEKPDAGISFRNQFLVRELSTRAGYFVLPAHSNVLAISLYQFGSVPFRQEKFGFAFARKVSPQISFGLQFNYYRVFLSEENRSAGVSGLELGLQYYLNRKLTMGLHLTNPYHTGIKLLSGKFEFSSALKFGILYNLSDSFCLVTELEKQFDQKMRIKAAMEYTVLQKLYLRLGTAGNPTAISGGIGFRLNNMTIDLATVFNQYLGNSPGVSIQYSFK